MNDCKGHCLLKGELSSFFQWWEETSYQLECKQASKVCVSDEFQGLVNRKGPTYHLTFDPDKMVIQRQVLSQGKDSDCYQPF